jgi:hypothetical protein
MHWPWLAILATTKAFVLPRTRPRLQLRAAEDDCATAEECSAEAEVLKLKAETLKLEAQKAELLLAKEVAARQKRIREEDEALQAMAETEKASKVVDPVQAAALRDADFQAKILERRDEASRKLVAEAAAEEAVPIASDVAKTIAGPVLLSDCETVEECEVEESSSKEEASLLSLEAEKLRLEAQKAELVLARQRLERTGLCGNQEKYCVDVLEPPRHRADAATGTTSRRWRGIATPSRRRSYGSTSRRWLGAPEI